MCDIEKMMPTTRQRNTTVSFAVGIIKLARQRSSGQFTAWVSFVDSLARKDPLYGGSSNDTAGNQNPVRVPIMLPRLILRRWIGATERNPCWLFIRSR